MTANANEWIRDRRPTAADGDEGGDVRMKSGPSGDNWRHVHWSYVGAGVPWQHTSLWQPPAEHVPSEPDRIAALEQRVAELEAFKKAVTATPVRVALEQRVLGLEKVVSQMIKGPNVRRSLGI
jgi:hypothetical protein